MQDPPIVVVCDACKARFLLDRKLVKGYRAAQVRCRKCGGPIRITIPEPPVSGGSRPARTRRDPVEAPPPRSTAPAPPRMEGSGAGRTTRSFAAAESPLEEESESGVPPDNLVDLQSVRKSDRGSMTSGSHDISRDITAEIPHAGLPFPEAIPEVEPRSPAESSAVQPVPGNPPSTGGGGIIEEPFQGKGEVPVALPKIFEKPPIPPLAPRDGGFWRGLTLRFGPSITFVVAALWTTFGILFVVLIVHVLLQYTDLFEPESQSPRSPPGTSRSSPRTEDAPLRGGRK